LFGAVSFRNAVTTAELPGQGTGLLHMIGPDYLANVIRVQFRWFDPDAIASIAGLGIG